MSNHRSTYSYDPAAARVSLRLKLYPSIFAGQSAESWQVTVNGEAVEPIYMSGYGDDVALWQSRDPIESAVVIADGIVVTDDTAGVVRDLPAKASICNIHPQYPVDRARRGHRGPGETDRVEGRAGDGSRAFGGGQGYGRIQGPRPPAARRQQPRLWLWEPAYARTTLTF